MDNQEQKCGGYSNVRESDDNSRKVLAAVQNQVLKHENFTGSPESLTNHTYQTQVVAGTNYKFNVDNHELVVWHKLDNSYVLTSLTKN